MKNKVLTVIVMLLATAFSVAAQTIEEKQSPQAWLIKGIKETETENYGMALECLGNALDGFRKLGMTEYAILTLKYIAFAQDCSYNLAGAIDANNRALALCLQNEDEEGQMEIAGDLYRLSRLVGDVESATKYAALMDSVFNKSSDLRTRFDYCRQKGKEARSQNQLLLAEKWFLKGKSIAEQDTSSTSNKYLISIDLSSLYMSAGRYEEALPYALSNIREVHSYFSDISLANIYAKMGDKDNCFRYLDSLVVLGPERFSPSELSRIYATRGNCFYNFSDYQSALADYKQAEQILASQTQSPREEAMDLYPLIGAIEYQLGHYEESERYYNLYAELVKGIYGEKSLKYANAQIHLANIQGYAGKIEQGCSSYSSATILLKNLIRSRLPYMNSIDRESFWEALSALLTRMTPYALKADLVQNEFTETCYDALLMTKAFLLDTERSLFDIVKNEGDEADMRNYQAIVSMKNKIAQWGRRYVDNTDSILFASNRVSRMEDVLMKRCTSFGDMTSFLDVDYRALKSSLGRNEVVLDFTDFRAQSGANSYAVYIVNKNQHRPMLKLLCTGNELDSVGAIRPDMYYDSDNAERVLELLWNPVKEHIPYGATVYYIPSGRLFQMSLEALPLGDGTILGDHYHFVRLSSARELVMRHEKSGERTKSAVLYGGLQYDVETRTMASNSSKYNLAPLMAMRGDVNAQGDSPFLLLPESEREIDAISLILETADYEVTPYSGAEGTEESFLSMHGHSPDILHLATHGFYYAPDNVEDVEYLKGYKDAMYLSGLIMSGGNAGWSGRELPEGVLGGVLTANNIAGLDLSGTDMVVLSACKSGQGNPTSEGLYGLQRAFKKAGAGTLVMTLWNVSDKVATEFMIKFYETLMLNGGNKLSAFEKARSLIRLRYPDPFYWASFVILDP